MTDGTRALPILYSKEIPDTFVDRSEVVVEGAMRPDGVFVAHTLLAKCPSKYEAQNRVAKSDPDQGRGGSIPGRDGGVRPR